MAAVIVFLLLLAHHLQGGFDRSEVLEGKVAEQAQTITDLQATLAKKEGMEETVVEQAQVIANLQAALARKEAAMTELEGTSSHKDAVINELRVDLGRVQEERRSFEAGPYAWAVKRRLSAGELVVSERAKAKEELSALRRKVAEKEDALRELKRVATFDQKELRSMFNYTVGCLKQYVVDNADVDPDFFSDFNVKEMAARGSPFSERNSKGPLKGKGPPVLVSIPPQ